MFLLHRWEQNARRHEWLADRTNLLNGHRILCVSQVRLKDSLVSSLHFCKAKDTELAWIDGVLDMRVVKVDTGVMLEDGLRGEEAAEDGCELAMDVSPDLSTEQSVAAAAQRAMKNLFGEDEKEPSDESDIIPTLEPLSSHEVSIQKWRKKISSQFAEFLFTLFGILIYVFFFLKKKRKLKHLINNLPLPPPSTGGIVLYEYVKFLFEEFYLLVI